MELIGLPSSRCRPPTRDVRERYREAALKMMQASNVPRLGEAAAGSAAQVAATISAR
jgi:hypothetical protein